MAEPPRPQPPERTWDCLCHGSRFDRLGGLINGPANRGLEPVAPAVALERAG